MRIAVLCSGRGSNFERITRAARAGEIPDSAVVCCVVDRPCGAQELAAQLNVECLKLEPSEFPNRQQWAQAMAQTLKARGVELVVLAGFLRKIESSMLEAFPGRILNIHPALLPAFGGPGMYGLRVHEAVLASGVKESGPTVHVVDEIFDHGPIVMQEKVPVIPGDTPQTLAARVLQAEHRLYPRAVAKYIKELNSPSC